jgi:hypothetical protein
MRWLRTAKNQNPQATQLSQIKRRSYRETRMARGPTRQTPGLVINSVKPMN